MFLTCLIKVCIKWQLV